ncbi:paraquat-inducible protein A [Ohtaekwangia koreensis]|uniref:Paraquat-inducible protein A n=1 Tax=Ohtaekwangia koreensis TaxID=688867 RepID=A0A1T5M286_9BACT|nr:paraquat-inducible protein A [Ohtaekwangia koreensis]SKC82387.1 Paraquat-inducible protein A [Ohtaekwangia koreensis]
MKLLQRSLLIFVGGILLVIAAWSGFQVYHLSNERAEIKKDYSVLNNITYGLLSVNAWRDHLVRVVTHRIDDFEFTKEQEAVVKEQLSQVLHAVINKADSMIDRKQKTVRGKLRRFAVKTLVDEEKIHAKVPELAATIVNEIKKPKNREKLKFLAQSKLKEFGSVTYDSANDVNRVKAILNKYGTADVADFNRVSENALLSLQEKAYFFAYIILGIMIVFLIMWWALKNQVTLHTPLFIISILLALIVLFVGLTSPMIEIDARIKEMSFLLIGERISFSDQVIFFQSKSIVDVVRVLLETGQFDSAFVGVLILIFSIVFPIGKLLATKLYLLGSEKWRNSKVIQFFAFKSGKWSMADVNVVAIFMAYIGFKGILDSQLSNLNMKTESLASISTNETSLQPGFILFVAFVLFGLILSVILQRITIHVAEKQKHVVVDKHVNHAIA